jgi:hypothetical protein
MANNDKPLPESIAERFLADTAHLTSEGRQRVLSVIILAGKVRDARLAAAGAIEKARSKMVPESISPPAPKPIL